tara:strand:- start:10 stop:336 length:327 start_codon:yes stop_codon:yes gene_type:complete
MTNKIEINGETYIKESEVKKHAKYKASPVQIVVLNRGWIVVGNVSESGDKTVIQNAAVIRRWGTANGLGELAMKGKLPDTILDACPDITTDTSNVVFLMNCEQSKWTA